MAVIKEYVNLDNIKKIIVGFPTHGMVGSIALEYIITKKKLELVGHIRAKGMPAVSIIRESRPQAPIRIYRDNDILFLVSDISIPDAIAFEFARDIASWIESKKPEEVILVGGVHKRNIEKKIYVISWKHKYLDELELEHMKLGFLVGVYGPLMLEFMERNIDGFLIMGEADDKTDPGMAARLIRILNNRLNLDVDPSSLEKEAQTKKIETPTWDPYPSIYG